MRLSESLRWLVKPKPVGSVPIEVSAVLLDDLYSALTSFAIGATGAVLVGAIAAAHTRQPLVDVSDRCDRYRRYPARTPYDRIL